MLLNELFSLDDKENEIKMEEFAELSDHYQTSWSDQSNLFNIKFDQSEYERYLLKIIYKYESSSRGGG